MHRGMQWPEPRLTWPDGRLVCRTFRVAYEAFRESGRFKQSSKIKVNVVSLSHANYGGAVGIWRLMDVLDRNGVRATIGANGLAVEDLSTHATAAGTINTIEGRMTFAAFAGAAVEAELKCGETNIACLLDRDADLTPGRAVTLRARADACLVLPEE